VIDHTVLSEVAQRTLSRRCAAARGGPTGARRTEPTARRSTFDVAQHFNLIGEILQERFGLSPELFGALILFTLVNTLLPGFALRLPVPEFETPEVPRTPGGTSEPS
jgi:hypothetical protein